MSGAGFELHELRRLRKRKALPIPASAMAILGEFGLSTAAIGAATYALMRRCNGVNIMFSVPTGPNQIFSWSANSMLGVEHKTFAEARRWVAAYANGHGQTITEVVKERERQPVGEDRKLLAAGGCKESWLGSDVPKLFAKAAMRCQHEGGYCLSDGYCHYGDCDMSMTPTTQEHPE